MTEARQPTDESRPDGSGEPGGSDPEPRARRLGLAILAAGLVLRLLAVLALPPAELTGDERYYWGNANRVLRTGDVHDEFHPPGQSYLIAAARFVTASDGPTAPRLLNVLAYLATALALHSLAGSWRRGLPALSVLALHPLLIGFSAYLWNESNFLAFLCGAFALQLAGPPSVRRFAAAGALWACAALLRKITIGFFVAAIAIHWWRDRERPAESRVGARQVGAAVLAFALVLAPWVVRNQVRLGSPVLVSTDSMYQLWAGNQEGPYPAYTTFRTPFKAWKGAYRDFADHPLEREAEARRRALAFIAAEQPLWFFRKVSSGLQRLFDPDNFVLRIARLGQYGELSPAMRWFLRIATVLGEAAVLAWGIVALVRARWGTRKWIVLALLLWALTVHLAAVATTRHRLAIELLPLLLTGVPLEPWTRGRRWVAAAAGAVILGAALTVSLGGG